MSLRFTGSLVIQSERGHWIGSPGLLTHGTGHVGYTGGEIAPVIGGPITEKLDPSRFGSGRSQSLAGLLVQQNSAPTGADEHGGQSVGVSSRELKRIVGALAQEKSRTSKRAMRCLTAHRLEQTAASGATPARSRGTAH